MDRYYGFKSVSTAVDINYTDAINENDIYDWEMTDEQIKMSGNFFFLIFQRQKVVEILLSQAQKFVKLK